MLREASRTSMTRPARSRAVVFQRTSRRPAPHRPAHQPTQCATSATVARVIYAGIDEAGYGPLLGPLCVGSAAFVIGGEPASSIGQGEADPTEPPTDLWKLLDAGVCRKPTDRRRRIAVADSKKLKGAGKRPLQHLERGVLAFLPAIPADDGALFELLGCAPRATAATPWHASPLPVPVDLDAGGVAIARNLLARAYARSGTTLGRLAVEMLDPPAFNALYRTLGNKSALNMSLVFDALRRIDLTRGGRRAFVAIDRQGGRASYAAELEAHIGEGRPVRTISESETRSAYAIGDDLLVTFEIEAETRHLPVALASMAAKYAREVSMRRLNAFFTSRREGLAPTAGYVEDGRRFLAEVKPILAAEGIATADFTRSA